MSAWSKVKRQVKRNVREHPKARRRRLAQASADRLLAYVDKVIRIHEATRATFAINSFAAKAIGATISFNL